MTLMRRTGMTILMPDFDNGIIQLYQSDARSLPIPDNSVDCVVTSPPYWGLRDYSTEGQLGLEETPEEWVVNMVAVFREVWRVLKPTGTLWVNLGDSYSDKQLTGQPWKVAFALQADGWYLRSDIIWSKPNPMPESARDRPTKAHEYVFLLTKSPRYYYDADAIREPQADTVHTRERYKYAPSSGPKHDENKDTNILAGDFAHYWSRDGSRNKRTVWEIPIQPYPEAHFATYPEKLVEPCILAGCPQDGVVLDPFVGSGTTLAVAQRIGRKGIGTDISTEYLQLAEKRICDIPLPMML